MSLPDNFKGVATFWAKPEHRKMVVEGSGTINPQTAHHGEAGSIDQREVLIAVGESNLPGGFKVRSANWFDGGCPAAQFVPESFGGTPVDPVPH